MVNVNLGSYFVLIVSGMCFNFTFKVLQSLAALPTAE